MLRRKNCVIVGLTTFDTEFLRLSVPALARLRGDIYLIVHNDNPNARVEKRGIRRLGYSGPLHIINVNKSGGARAARLDILAAIPKLKIRSDWMIFADDDGLMNDAEIPAVRDGVFAVMQNTLFIRKRLLDLLRVINNPKNYNVDNSNVIMERARVGIVGTLVRTDMMVRIGELIRPIMPNIMALDATPAARAPENIVMWFYLQMYARHLNPDARPIYMDKTNYIAVTLGHNSIRCDRPAEFNERNIQRYCDLFAEQLQRPAAPAGQ
ncbi:MAG: hypothetical protein LBJ73_03525 [Rickettsiales bacterium]|jgi:hypothetical protein|nr:hypothetical protein [Rickettsiales bacterium]